MTSGDHNRSEFLSTSDEVMERWRGLNGNGLLSKGVSAAIDPGHLPAWITSDRVLAAQKSIGVHLLSVNFSSLGGLMIILQTRYGFVPLLHTKKSESIPALFMRYLQTTLHVRTWYESDILDPKSEGYKSIHQVRQMHENIYSKMQSIPTASDDRIWVSQYSMSVTQWSFIGLVMMFPEKCGLHGEDKKVLEDINYLWRVIGYLHGIEDQYNMCFESVDKTIALCNIMFQQFFLPVLCSTPKENEMGYEMGLDIVKSLKGVLSGASGEVYLKYWYEVFGMDDKLIPSLSITDRFHYYLLDFVMARACRSHKVKGLLLKISMYKVDKYSRIRQKHFAKLVKSHPDVKYSPEAMAKHDVCPFSTAAHPSAD